MIIKMRKIRANAIIDYTVLIATVAFTLILMGGYLKRGLSGKWKEAVDIYGKGRQYDAEVILR